MQNLGDTTAFDLVRIRVKPSAQLLQFYKNLSFTWVPSW